MNSEGAKEPSKDLQSREQRKKRPGGTGQSAPERPERSVQGAPVAQQPARSRNTAPSKTPTGPPHQTPAEHQVSPLSESEKEAIQKRVEGRARVPPKIRDSFKQFFCSPAGALKVVRLSLLMEAIACFVISRTHELYIAITVLETCIVLFFILIYMLTIHHLMTCIHWPLLDLINSFITAVSLFIVASLTIQEKEKNHLLYVGGALCFAAAIVCLVDATIVTKTMRNNVKRVLGLESETRSSPSR
ncbi:CKLF-like MARVEL transmembrane domain-containing protein 1 [Rhinolophus sinicus]|uniref:CKLF-like MARVEL transmembrane domain-containing protein 1 n=1 Tax=Rhinolophus sinicus TaxID=89399 RepID=UPI003D78E5A0